MIKDTPLGRHRKESPSPLQGDLLLCKVSAVMWDDLELTSTEFSSTRKGRADRAERE